MNVWQEKLWFWVAAIFGGIAILSFFSVFLPIMAVLFLPLLLLVLIFLFWRWLKGIAVKTEAKKYDESGARYTEASILSKDAASTESTNGTDKT